MTLKLSEYEWLLEFWRHLLALEERNRWDLSDEKRLVENRVKEIEREADTHQD